MMPERVLAAIGYHGESILGLTHVGIQPNTAVPVLYLLAGNDQQRNAKIHPYITRRIRPTGAPWTTVIQPGIRHANMGDQTFVLLWLEEVIKMRLPDLDRKGGGGKLQPLSKSCWFGKYQLANDASKVFNLKGDYFKDPSILSLAQVEGKERPVGPAIWLPNEIVAKAWLKYCRTGGGKLTRSSTSVGAKNSAQP